MPHPPRIPTIAEELDRAHAVLAHWKYELRRTGPSDYERIVECRLNIGKATQRIRNLRRELQEGY